jgi:hypothetical protein
MTADIFIFWMVQVLVFLLGVSIGHSILILRIRREENRKRELELALIDKRSEAIKQGTMGANLEEVLYHARIQREIDEITRKNPPSK